MIFFLIHTCDGIEDSTELTFLHRFTSSAIVSEALITSVSRHRHDMACLKNIEQSYCSGPQTVICIRL